ncbi:MAG TPA: transposase [Euryarchaeota archaeon]|nr:putative transposase [archaeon BMS3Bbin15]HDL14759.1 transposase [Euryarchaeota archaeon]
MMLKTYKYRLESNREQKQKLEATLDTCRYLYNDTLACRERQAELYRLPMTKQWITVEDQINALPGQKQEDKYLPLVHSQVLQDVIHRVDNSFKNFFRHLKHHEQSGYPRFKCYNRYNSFTYPQTGFKIVDRKLELSYIGKVNVKIHKSLRGKIKTCTIKRDIDAWYACFSVKIEDSLPEKTVIKSAVGIDVGINPLIAQSNGEKTKPPKFILQSEHKLAKEQRKLSRKQKESHNNKQRVIVAKVHRHIRQQRMDFHHKLSRELVAQYDFIAFEDLRIKNMIRNHNLAKSISDVSWNILQSFTAYKAEWAGKVVTFVNPKNTSQECSSCGKIVKKNLSIKVHKCPYCGLVLDRHVNAAINILKRGLIKVGLGYTDLMPVRGLARDTPMTQEVPCVSGE